MFDPVFGAAYIDNGTRHRLLGVRLRPFCLWHLFLLQALDSPFIRNGSATVFDLKTAIGICRLGYRQSHIARPIYPILGARQLRKQVQKFLDFVGDYLNKPDYNIVSLESPTGKPLPRVTPPPAPVLAAFEAAQGARISVKEAWEMPIGEAYIAQSMHLRLQGAMVDFMTEDERLFQRELIQAGIK